MEQDIESGMRRDEMPESEREKGKGMKVGVEMGGNLVLDG